MSRSVNVEINLNPGRYSVLMKITAFRHQEVESTEEAVSQLASKRREKLVQIGLSYDLAHAKGRVVEMESEKRAREECERSRKEAERKKQRDEMKRKLQREWIKERKLADRKKRVAEKRAKRDQNNANSQKSDELPGIGIRINGRQQPDMITSYPSPKWGDFYKPKSSPELSDIIPTVQVNGSRPQHQHHQSNPLKRKRELDSRRPSIDTHLAVDGIDGSDLEYLEGFEFDSDIDMPEEPPPMDKDSRSSTIASCAEEFDNSADPWNAVCVVGLRVYSKDPKLCLEVARPVLENGVEASLDMDDPAVSATNEMIELMC